MMWSYFSILVVLHRVAKGAMLTHGNLVANLIQADTYIGGAFDKYEELNEDQLL